MYQLNLCGGHVLARLFRNYSTTIVVLLGRWCIYPADHLAQPAALARLEREMREIIEDALLRLSRRHKLPFPQRFSVARRVALLNRIELPSA